MENYIVKVVIETVTGTVVASETFETNSMIEIKAFGNGTPIENFVHDTITDIAAKRRDSPHHHQNRLD
jgi:hypothetical protein